MACGSSTHLSADDGTPPKLLQRQRRRQLRPGEAARGTAGNFSQCAIWCQKFLRLKSCPVGYMRAVEGRVFFTMRKGKNYLQSTVFLFAPRSMSRFRSGPTANGTYLGISMSNRSGPPRPNMFRSSLAPLPFADPGEPAIRAFRPAGRHATVKAIHTWPRGTAAASYPSRAAESAEA